MENGDVGRVGCDFQDGLGETVCYLKGGGLVFRRGNLQHLDVIESLVINVLYKMKSG